MALTIAGITELIKPVSGNPLLAFLTIKTNPVRRLVNNNQNVGLFYAFPFKVVLPTVQDGEAQGAYYLQIVFDNTSRLLVDYVREKETPVMCDLYLAFLSSFRVKQVEFKDLELAKASWTTQTCTCTFWVTKIFNTSILSTKYVAEDYPGARL